MLELNIYLKQHNFYYLYIRSSLLSKLFIIFFKNSLSSYFSVSVFNIIRDIFITITKEVIYIQLISLIMINLIITLVIQVIINNVVNIVLT